jgi:hypothetical protein
MPSLLEEDLVVQEILVHTVEVVEEQEEFFYIPLNLFLLELTQ